MENIIELQYRDKQNWVTVDGIITNWTNYSKKYKQERIQPFYVAPAVVTDTWNGRAFDLQFINWESYFFELSLKESEVHQLNKLKACSDIRIIEYAKNEAGLYITKTYIPDLSSPELFIISEPTRANKTSSWKTSIIFKVNRTVINKGDSIDQTNQLKFTTAEWNLQSETLPPANTNIFAVMTSTRIGVINAGSLQTFDYIAGSWQAVGNALATGYTTQSIAIVSLNIDNVVIFVDTTDKLAKYTFDGTDWTLTGNVFTFAAAKDVPAIAKLDIASVAVFDATSKLLETYTFDGNDWTKTGNSLAITIASLASIAISGLTSTSIAYIDSVNSELRIYDWDGTDWTLDFATAIVIGDNILLTALSSTEIAVIDDDNQTLKQYTSTGSAWSQTLDILALNETGYNSISTLDATSVVAGLEDGSIEWLEASETILVDVDYKEVTSLTATRIATVNWNDSPGGIIQAYDYASSVWSAVGNSFATAYTSTDKHVITALNSSVIAIFDPSGYLTTYTFDGTDWTKTGNSLNIGASVVSGICTIDSVNIALYNSSALETYTWDGTDWTLDGNPLSVSTGVGADPSLSNLSATEIVFIDSVNKEIRRYSWAGTDWMLDFATSVAGGSSLFVAGLSSTEIAYIDANNDILQKYIISGSSWVTYGSEFNGLSTTNELISMVSLNEDSITLFDGSSQALYNYSLSDINLNSFNNFESGVFSYYTDFDVIPWNKETEQIIVEWYDGTEKLLQTVNKAGYQMVMYFTSSEIDEFMLNYKQAGTATINGVAVTEKEIEVAPMGEDYIKVILKGVAVTTVSDFNVSPNETYTLAITINSVTTDFKTDWQPTLISEQPIINNANNQTGINIPTKRISKTVKQLKFYLNESEAFDLKNQFELHGSAVTLDAVPVLESRPIDPTKKGVDIYEVEVNCMISTGNNYE